MEPLDKNAIIDYLIGGAIKKEDIEEIYSCCNNLKDTLINRKLYAKFFHFFLNEIMFFNNSFYLNYINGNPKVSIIIPVYRPFKAK